ncbi:GNAT family N-acetyltransferase [Methyloversatilis thermotolerans]|uniref:GNAT family N-acetyltransferase n=1 Tax=Methyloversatilis thermotolerans TaxID=1346290 RepID=UPI0003739ECA|nr:GNAT family N-acetyltransferase [Methyloversatilis thermotolerans]
MTIEPATREDIPALCGLLATLFAQEAEFAPDTAAQARGLAMIIDDARVGTVLLARRDGQVLGMVNLLYTVSTALGERVLLLEDMVVAPRARRDGVGSALLQAAIAHARAQRCPRITLLTDRVNADAQRFYARHGFVASDMLTMRWLATECDVVP